MPVAAGADRGADQAIALQDVAIAAKLSCPNHPMASAGQHQIPNFMHGPAQPTLQSQLIAWPPQ